MTTEAAVAMIQDYADRSRNNSVVRRFPYVKAFDVSQKFIGMSAILIAVLGTVDRIVG